MKKINVKIPEKSYNIFWVDGFSQLKKEIQKFISIIEKNKSIKKNTSTSKSSRSIKDIVITNTTIGKIYRKQIVSLFPDIQVIYISDGEKYKKLETIEKISSQMLELGCNRSTRIWALGGGVIGDISGFVASVFMRGIKYIQIPTTLLAMVDSSAGGKTGVNLSTSKNSIGSFYQPEAVLINLEFLNTLPQREINCGLAEIIKSSLLKDKSFFKLIENNTNSILNKNLEFFEKLSFESIKIKSWVVTKDEKEQDLRAILNFGHTLAHAIESYFNYEKINHGEAVSIGLSFAVFYSFHKNYISKKTWNKIYYLLDELKLYKNLSDIFSKKQINKKLVSELISLMHNDKKNMNDNIRFIFINAIGSYKLAEEIHENELNKILLKFTQL